jgi:hypothetical protein
MRVFYADTGLSQDLGHHANACRLMTAAWRNRGFEVSVAASAIIAPDLSDELGAAAHFRVHTYWTGDDDPFCGWLSGFFHAARCTQEDLDALGPYEADDLLYVNSIQPAQLMALADFMRLPGTRPRIVAELGTGPGLDFEWRDELLHFRPRDPRYDPKATLYRFAARRLAERSGIDPILVTFHPTCSAVYGQLLRRDVQTLPVPHKADSIVERDAEGGPLTIGILGHQRADKGYHLVPEIALAVLAARPDLRLLLHNGAPDYMRDTQAAVRMLAARDARIIVDERVADHSLWQALLTQCDLILCPYHHASYIAAYSAVVGEALALGVPLVVPAGTTLARTLGSYGWPGATFDGFDPASIAATTLGALSHLDVLRVRAREAAQNWRQTMGAERTVAGILACLEEPGAADEDRTAPARKVA